MQSKGLKLTDILVTFVIAVVFALIFRGWTFVYDALKIGGIQLEQLSYGMWFMAATAAFLIIRKPGVAFLAEAAAASGELIAGSPYGVELLIYGIIQGLCAELIFAAFRYKNYTAAVAGLAGVLSGFGAAGMDIYKGYISDLQTWNMALYFIFRAIGSFMICGWLAYGVTKALERTGVTQLVRPVSSADYEALGRKKTL